ncbi:MAG: hypothetical protein ACJAVN_000576 [Roseivirga sp.]|jgi:hypothetical protein
MMSFKKALVTSFLLSFFSLTSAQAQKPDATDSLYIGGARAYAVFMMENLRYPQESKRKGNEGLLIYEISVSTEGVVSIRFMTKVDEHVEKMIIPLIQATSDQWLKKSTDYKVYQPVSFSFGYRYYEDFTDNVPSFRIPAGLPYLGEITVTGVSSKYLGSKHQFSEGSDRFSMTVKNEQDGEKLKIYKKQEQNLVKHLSKNKLDRAYKAINEMIRYNPFDKSLIQQRRRIEKQLGKDEYRVYDILWLQAMEHIASIQTKKP